MKRLYTDAHLHLTALPHEAASSLIASGNCMVCSSVFSLPEWQHLNEIATDVKTASAGSTNGDITILKAFGIHPQNPDAGMLPVLEKLLSESGTDAPDAIGEAGYDFFTKVFEAQEKQQDEVWYGQIELAEKFGKPLVVHLRHAVDRMFRDAGLLKKLPSVIFHSFPGSPLEAEAIRKRGINAYFSFGKPVMNNRRNSIECVRKLPDEWILFETDAPYQTLKGETATLPSDIERVYRIASKLHSMNISDGEDENSENGCERLAEMVRGNFRKAFLLD